MFALGIVTVSLISFGVVLTNSAELETYLQITRDFRFRLTVLFEVQAQRVFLAFLIH